MLLHRAPGRRHLSAGGLGPVGGQGRLGWRVERILVLSRIVDRLGRRLRRTMRGGRPGSFFRTASDGFYPPQIYPAR